MKIKTLSLFTAATLFAACASEQPDHSQADLPEKNNTHINSSHTNSTIHDQDSSQHQNHGQDHDRVTQAASTNSSSDTTLSDENPQPPVNVEAEHALEEIVIHHEQKRAADSLAFKRQRSEKITLERFYSPRPEAHPQRHSQQHYQRHPQLLREPQQSNEQYSNIDENDVKSTSTDPLSTFSIDVDTAAYSNVRRMLERNGVLPPKDAVKLEEMVNYFSYDYPTPTNLDQPFSVTTEVTTAPWNADKLLLQIGLKGYEPEFEERPAANLVFLIDVSGSMQHENKLPLLKKSLGLLVNQMTNNDRIALVTYAGRAGLVLESTPGSEKRKIMRAIENLHSGGSTHGSAGITLAYEVAEEHMVANGINRILIASDGDMNVGITSLDALKDLIEEKRKSGIALTTLGFGTGNYNDAIMEQLADVGDGNAAYIDSLHEAQKVLVHEMHSTLLTIAKDVKIQVEFNPGLVAEYRLLGYENRLLNTEDFRNDNVDAGEIGAGHTVTALYEITLNGSDAALIPTLRYGSEMLERSTTQAAQDSDELAFVRLRYKEPTSNTSKEIGQAISAASLQQNFDAASENIRFAAAVSGFAQLLRHSDYRGEMSYPDVLRIAQSARHNDEQGYRSEFLSLVKLAHSFSTQRLSGHL